MSNPKVGDYPVRFTCNLGTDISSATVKQINFKKGGGSILGPKTATFTTDGTDGLMYYDTYQGRRPDFRIQGTNGLFHGRC
jgi:hypothetical protein